MPLRCLLVDDSEEFLASATRLLESQGAWVVGRARSVEEALRLAQDLRPEVALVDVELGAESGFELAAALAAALPAPRVVLISTHDEDELVDLVAASPAVGFLRKTAIGVDAISRLAGA